MLTAERLRELLRYDPDSGLFVRLVTTSSNAQKGDVAGSFTNDGYLRIRVDGKDYRAHRLAWLYMTGSFPVDQIDHVNGVKTDNRFANLRPATNRQNQQNTTKRGHNTSGFKGVTWDKAKGKWMAAIVVDGRRFFLAYTDTPEEAAAWYTGCAPWLHGEFHRPLKIHIHIHTGTPNGN